MISAYITWTCRPELFSVSKFHVSPGLMTLGILICMAWALGAYLRASKAMKKWRDAGSRPASRPQDPWSGVVLAAVIGVVLIMLRSRNPQGMELGPVAVRWYSLMFLIGFIAGYRIMWHMFRHEGAPEKWLPTLLIYVGVATIVGARLGHCLFYEWPYYSAHPEKILCIWEGGLASHGGTIGIIIAIFIFCKVSAKCSPLWVFDRLCIPIALVACLIRLGNLFNSEIYGHATTLPWGFVFPGSHGVPCHPTQIYEASAYLVLFGILMWMYWRRNAEERPGLLLGVFFIWVFAWRFVIEFVKNPQEDFENNMLLNMGQLLSVPFILAGIILVYYAMSHPRKRIDFPDKFPDEKKK